MSTCRPRLARPRSSSGKKKLHRLTEREILAFEDETGFSRHPRLGRVWSRRSQRLQMPTGSEHRQRLKVFGRVAPLTGWQGLLRLSRGNARAFLVLLRCLRHRLPGKQMHLYADRAPGTEGHSSKSSWLTIPISGCTTCPAINPG